MSTRSVDEWVVISPLPLATPTSPASTFEECTNIDAALAGGDTDREYKADVPVSIPDSTIEDDCDETKEVAPTAVVCYLPGISTAGPETGLAATWEDVGDEIVGAIVGKAPSIATLDKGWNLAHFESSPFGRQCLAVTHGGEVLSSALAGSCNAEDMLLRGCVPFFSLLQRCLRSPSLARTIHSVAVGAAHCLALTQGGVVYAWGSNKEGQLGLGKGYTGQPTQPVPLLIEDAHYSSLAGAEAGLRVTSIACGEWHNVAAVADGRVFTWGSNSHGQLGLAHSSARHASFTCPTHSHVPTLMPAFDTAHAGAARGTPTRQAKTVHCGAFFTAVLTFSGTLFTCGDDCAGQVSGRRCDSRAPCSDGKGSAAAAMTSTWGQRHCASLALRCREVTGCAECEGSVVLSDVACGPHHIVAAGRCSQHARPTTVVVRIGQCTGINDRSIQLLDQVAGRRAELVGAGAAGAASVIYDTGEVHCWGYCSSGGDEEGQRMTQYARRAACLPAVGRRWVRKASEIKAGVWCVVARPALPQRGLAKGRSGWADKAALGSLDRPAIWSDWSAVLAQKPGFGGGQKGATLDNSASTESFVKAARSTWQSVGLPHRYRAEVWAALLGNRAGIKPERLGELQTLADREEGHEDDWNTIAEVIELDLPRTFTATNLFQPGLPMSSALRGILRAYAMQDPELKYVQGMSYHAAILALVVGACSPAEDCDEVERWQQHHKLFAMFASLLHSGPLRHLLQFRMDLWECHCQVVDRLLFLALPDLQQALHRHDITVNLFLYPWFQALFSTLLPLPLVVFVWDGYLLYGTEFLYRTTIGILTLLAPALQGDQDGGDHALALLTQRSPESAGWLHATYGPDLRRSILSVDIPSEIQVHIHELERGNLCELPKYGADVALDAEDVFDALDSMF